MPSSKGKPTDPKLREKVKEEIKNETNKDGGGRGQWSAWKVSQLSTNSRYPYFSTLRTTHDFQASKLSKEYEKRGGGYEHSPGSKNKPKKGTPRPKSDDQKKMEENEANELQSPSPEKAQEKEKQKPKANIGAKKDKPSDETKGNGGKTTKAAAGEKEKLVEGTRKSARVAEKRKSKGQEEGAANKKTKK